MTANSIRIDTMRLLQLLDAILQTERKNGKTNQELAEKAGCSQQHINDLLNHKKNVRIETLKFGTILRLFPELQQVIEDYLEHHTLAGAQTSIGHAANGNNIHIEGAVTTSALNLGEISAAVLNNDKICDSCKVQILKIIQKHQK